MLAVAVKDLKTRPDLQSIGTSPAFWNLEFMCAYKISGSKSGIKHLKQMVDFGDSPESKFPFPFLDLSR